MVAAPAARRLTLTSAEIAALTTLTGAALPSGFATQSNVDQDRLRAAVRGLRERGVVTDSSTAEPFKTRPVASVAANLAVLAAPVLTVRAEVSVHGAGLRAVYAVSGPLGASLFALADGGVELSLFAAVALGRELSRAAPDPLSMFDTTFSAALGGPTNQRLAGRLPLTALGHVAEAYQVDPRGEVGGVVDTGLRADEVALADRVRQAATGTLWCRVSGRAPDGRLLVGQAVWLCTETGWIGVRPDPDRAGRRMVSLVPVTREGLGHWLAPYIAGVLEVAGDRS